MKKLPKWYQDYIAKVAGMKNDLLLEEVLEQTHSVGASYYSTPGDRSDEMCKAASAELKKRLVFCGFLEAEKNPNPR